MKAGRTLEEFKKQNGIGTEEVMALFEAVTQAFPVIALGNLTNNTYTLIRKAGFFGEEVVAKGNYDDLINYGVDNIHPNYQKLYLDTFSREKLLYQFGQGRHEVGAKLCQKNWDKQYQWGYTQAIRVNDKNGDICEVSITRFIEDVHDRTECSRRPESEPGAINSGKTLEELEELTGIGAEEVMALLEGVIQAYPMIVLANLSRNSYTLLKDDGFLVGSVVPQGNYDDLIDYGVENIHPNYKSTFMDNFARDHLLYQFGQGIREVYAKLYQKGRNNQYQWVSTHVIRVNDRDGDICEICINKILEDAQKSRERIGKDYY